MKYTAKKAMGVSIFKLLWAMYDDLLEERNSLSAKDSSGTIIGWYAGIIEKRIAQSNGGEYVLCELCGQPLPEGEQMFRYHGYSGNCPTEEVK